MKLSRGYLSAAIVLSLALPACVTAFTLPGLDKVIGMAGHAKDLGAIDEPHEIEIGSGIASSLLGAAPLVKDQAVQQYVNKIGLWLALQTERPDLPWHFGVLDSNNVNAFATPGGYVFITRGLLQRMHSEDELAGVLAHEISHVIKRHHLVAIQKGAKRGLMTDLAGMAVSQHANSAVLDKVISAGTELYARGLDKGDEYEADRMGVVIAARAGYDPFGLPAVLQTLDSINVKDSSFALMFKTHPTPLSRLQALDSTMGMALDAYAHRGLPNPRFKKYVR